jgi:hypothetical protein
MTTAKANSGLDRKMASPRGCVAFSALDAVRSAVSCLSRLLGTQQLPPQIYVSVLLLSFVKEDVCRD